MPDPIHALYMYTNASRQVGATALHLAASHGYYETMKLLVEALADVNSITKVSFFTVQGSV